MGFSIEKNNIVSIENLAADVATNLSENGFDIVSLDQQNQDLNLSDKHRNILLQATTGVDPLAEETNQPWLIYIEADDEDDTLDIYVVTPTQVLLDESGSVTISTSNSGPGGTLSKSGFLFKNSEFTTDNQRNHFFSFQQWGFDGADEESVPLSYFLTVTDHGLAFCMWAESFDRFGDKFAWFAVSRMVDNQGNINTSKKEPLFCVFSHDGGGGEDLDVPEPDGIMQFVVRESDVNAPTFPTSATVDTADSTRIMNSVQQTSIYENGKYIINFLRGLNTQRYRYAQEIDIIAFASADVTSQYASHEVEVYDEAQPRKYRALNANHPNNTGMRLYFQVEGIGVTVDR